MFFAEVKKDSAKLSFFGSFVQKNLYAIIQEYADNKIGLHTEPSFETPKSAKLRGTRKAVLYYVRGRN
jgi:hypothetical protein